MLVPVVALALALSTPGSARSRGKLPDVNVLARLAPGAHPAALSAALSAMACAQSRGIGSKAELLTVIDFSLPSLEPRLWVFDLRKPFVLFAEHVTHGRGTGENMAIRFSNDDGSLQSSLGLFLTAETYEGKNGYSLKLDGLEPGVNDHARARAIVMHGAPYADPVAGRKQGRLGRSWGCPAVRPEIAVALMDAIRDGTFLFAWYPDDDWLAHSVFLHCEPRVAPPPPRKRVRALPRARRNATTR